MSNRTKNKKNGSVRQERKAAPVNPDVKKDEQDLQEGKEGPMDSEVKTEESDLEGSMEGPMDSEVKTEGSDLEGSMEGPMDSEVKTERSDLEGSMEGPMDSEVKTEEPDLQESKEEPMDSDAKKDGMDLQERKELLIDLDVKMEELKQAQEEMSENIKQLLSERTDQPDERKPEEPKQEKTVKKESRKKEVKKPGKKRSAEILGVFAKHNFYANGLTPEELRSTLEDLGPTFVKIGQIMSSRVDLLPEKYCKELEKLRQNVQELDPALARAVIEKETGKKIDEIYKEFRDKPLGSASVGQAHYAVLKDGTPVVTKVQRPLIADMMRQDFVLLKKLASVFNVVMEGGENSEDQLDLLGVIEEFEKVTEEELDCRVEAANTRFFKENCIEDESLVTCPDVYDELTTERIFTMSFVDGYSIAKRDRLIEDGYDVEDVARRIVDNYLHQVLDVGIFHADPHQGNIMVMHGIPCWIDFGMIGRITDADVNIIQSMILAILEGDVETIANSIMSMGAASPKTNRDKLIEDLDVFLDRYVTVTSLDDLDVSRLFDEICALAEKHHITMPGKFTMLIRSLGTIEGVIEQLCPELNLFEILSNKLMDRAKKSLDIEQQLISTGKDVLEIGKKAARIPALASDLLKSAGRGRMKINLELTGYDALLNRGNDTIKNIMFALFACVLFIGSSLLSLADISPKAPGGVPLLAAVGLIVSVALAIYAVRNISRRK